MTPHPDQLGFDALLADAATDNATRAFQTLTANLPDTMVEAIPFHLSQIDAHHAAMLAGDFERAKTLRKEARLLATKLNDGKPGILADDSAPGCVLARECRAKPDAPPLWGQDAAFIVTLAGIPIAVTLHGMFGIGGCSMPYAGFEIRAVDRAQPFLSATGYRSFLGASVSFEPGMTPDMFVRRVLEHYLDTELGGKFIPVSPEYR